MNQLFIKVQATDEKLANPLACIIVPDAFKLPDEILTSWQDIIQWLLENPEIIAQLIAAILAIFSSKTPNR